MQVPRSAGMVMSLLKHNLILRDSAMRFLRTRLEFDAKDRLSGPITS